MKIRNKSHWCVDKKHNKCGGKVSAIIKDKNYNLDSALKKENFTYSPCFCYCHKK
mgnify:CR=1 FL=1